MLFFFFKENALTQLAVFPNSKSILANAGFFFPFLKKFFLNTCLKGKVREREMQREIERSSTCWFSLQMALTVGSGPSRSQEPEVSSGSPLWVQGRPLGPSSAAFLGTLAETA